MFILCPLTIFEIVYTVFIIVVTGMNIWLAILSVALVGILYTVIVSHFTTVS